MKVSSGYQLTYCTNIHPGEQWSEVMKSLETYAKAVQVKVSPTQPFGLGLRLSDLASRELLQGDNLEDFANWLSTNRMYVFTMNGFPYGGFHRQVVKDDVHTPDWTTLDRVNYTLRLFGILARLLPKGMDGGISTSPLSYKPWLKGDKGKTEEVFKTSTKHLLMVLDYLIEVKAETGKVLHLDIEPEPDGLLENTAEVLAYFSDWLIPMGIRHLIDELGISEDEAMQAIYEHIQVCYDVCHFAVAYEAPRTVFSRLKEAKIGVGKIQISAALKADLSDDPKQRDKVLQELQPFNESTYLHQVIERSENNQLTQYPDLPQALENIRKPEAREWRTHFHVPVFLPRYQSLQSTQDDITEVLRILKEQHVTNHLEVETYTWDVLPTDLQTDLAASIQRELEWVLQNLR